MSLLRSLKEDTRQTSASINILLWFIKNRAGIDKRVQFHYMLIGTPHITGLRGVACTVIIIEKRVDQLNQTSTLAQ